MQGSDPARTGKDSTVVTGRGALSKRRSPWFSPIVQTHHAAGAMAMLRSFRFSTLAETFKESEGVRLV